MEEENKNIHKAKFCRMCGERLEDIAKFCPKCGTGFEQDNEDTVSFEKTASFEKPVNFEKTSNFEGTSSFEKPAGVGNYSNSGFYNAEKYPGKYGSPDIKSGNKTPIIILIVAIIVVFFGIVVFGGLMVLKGINSVCENIESVEDHEPYDDDYEHNKKEDDVQTVEKEDVTNSSEEGTDSVSDISDAVSETEVRNCLDRFIDWSGIRMMYNGEDYFGIDVQNALPLTLFYMTHGDARNNYIDDGELKISKGDIEDSMMEIFGQTYDTDDYVENSDDYMVHKLSDGRFLLTEGDWGDTYPKYDVTSIMAGPEDGTFAVATEYYMWSAPENRRLDNKLMYVDYVFKKDKSAPNGFYIIDMNASCYSYDSSESSTSSSLGYSDSELMDMAKKYYEMKNGETPPYVEIEEDPDEEDQVMIRLYEVAGDHTATWDWYIINRITGQGEDVIGNKVDLTEAL